MSMTMDELPRVILSNILSRVPGESLLRHRRVCKRWREAIDDSYFRNSLHCSKEQVVLYHEHDEEEIYFQKIDEEAATRMIEIGKFPELRGYVIQGTCKGLLFFVHSNDVKNNGELLINPLTKEILRLSRAPDLSPDMSVYGLGFDGSTNKYKMVQISVIDFDEKTLTCAMGARIYDFDKRSWRTCKAPPPPSHSAGPYGDFVFASGALNWFLRSCSLESDGWLARALLSFDLTKEEFGLIPIPDVFCEGVGVGDFDTWAQMHELGGSLALVHCHPNNIDVWVLRDYTSREWTRKYRIQPPGADGGYYVVGRYERDKLILGLPTVDMYLYDGSKDRFPRCWTEAPSCYASCWCGILSFVSLK